MPEEGSLDPAGHDAAEVGDRPPPSFPSEPITLVRCTNEHDQEALQVPREWDVRHAMTAVAVVQVAVEPSVTEGLSKGRRAGRPEPHVDDGLSFEVDGVASELEAPAVIRVLESQEAFVEAADCVVDVDAYPEARAARVRQEGCIIVLAEAVLLR